MDKYNKKGDPNRVPSDKEIRKILDRELRNNQEARRTFHDLKNPGEPNRSIRQVMEDITTVKFGGY